MKSYETFGIPLPLNLDNPYQMDLECALKGRIAVPEGPLCWAASLTENWLKVLADGFVALGVHLSFVQTREAPFRYSMRLSDHEPDEADVTQLLALGQTLDLPAPPNMVQICKVVDANIAYIPELEVYEFADFLKYHVCHEDWTAYIETFFWLDVDRPLLG